MTLGRYRIIGFACAPALALASGCAGTAPIERTDNVYRALGTEPFWSLQIADRVMEFSMAGDPDVIEAVSIIRPAAQTSDAGAAAYKGERISVRIEPMRCNDGMSDRTFPDTVRLLVDGRAFEGCGGEPLPPDDMRDANWQVTAIDSRVTPDTGDFGVMFLDDRIVGSMGCNRFSIPYTRAGSRILPGAPAMTTRRMCEDMSFEQQGLAILSQPVTMVGEAGERVTLSNAAGQIQLQRVP